MTAGPRSVDEVGASAVGAPPVSDLLTLVVAVCAISVSAPLIAATAVPVLAIAFWRNAFGASVTAGVMLVSRPRSLLLARRDRLVVLVAGLCLAAHFGFWMSSLRYTSVASSTAILATQPVWAALIARARGAVVPARAWYGIAISVLGVVVLTGIDLSLDRRALIGDLLSVVGTFFAAAYVTAGAVARRTVATGPYTTYTYATCALVLLPVVVLAGLPLTGYSAGEWWRIALLTASAQLLGHTLINRTLRTTSPTVVSLAILFEMPIAAVLAAVWLGQVPPPAVVPAVVVILVGLVVTITTGQRGRADQPFNV
jgi:drug/metabolite transporter (DMT)-like permease